MEEQVMSTIPKRWLGAFKAGHRASAREFIDEKLSYDLLAKIIESKYTDQASIDALDYITKFNNEFHKNVIKKGDTNALHNTDELRKDCYARENARNRDIMSVERHKRVSNEEKLGRPTGGTTFLAKPPAYPESVSGYESELIEVLDEKLKDPKIN